MECWMRWLVGVLVLATAAPALAFEGEIEAKSIGDASNGAVQLEIYVAKNGDLRVDTSAKGPTGQANRASYIKPAKGEYDYLLDHDQKRATKISKDTITKVAAGKFAVPPGYKVTDVPDMPEGMPNMKMPTTKEEAEKMREEWMNKMQEQQR